MSVTSQSFGAAAAGGAAAADCLDPIAGGRVINDGTGIISLELPDFVRRGTPATVSVRVNWSVVVAKAIARLYVIADHHRDPLLARVSLMPDVVPPHVSVTARLDRSTNVSAVVECGDGTLLQVRRWIQVIPAAVQERAGCASEDPLCPLSALAVQTKGGHAI
jgi:predicted secreted protein